MRVCALQSGRLSYGCRMCDRLACCHGVVITMTPTALQPISAPWLLQFAFLFPCLCCPLLNVLCVKLKGSLQPVCALLLRYTQRGNGVMGESVHVCGS